MINVEQIKEAHDFIIQLAKGINPTTGEIIEEDTIINDVWVSRQLFAISKVLDEIIKNEDCSVNKKKKEKFIYNDSIISKIKISDNPLSLSEIASNIVSLYNGQCKLTYKIISTFLVDEELLIPNEASNPKLIPSKKGQELGINLLKKINNNKEYYVVTYDKTGQKTVLDVLKKYCSFN